jgi:hypothetical protein
VADECSYAQPSRLSFLGWQQLSIVGTKENKMKSFLRRISRDDEEVVRELVVMHRWNEEF